MAPEFVWVNVEFPFGELYARSVVDAKTRELCTVAALTVGVFLLDVRIPLGTEVWVLYLIPRLLIAWNSHPYASILFAVASSALIVVGAIYSPPGPVPVKYTIFNRSMAVAIVWVLTVMLTKRQ